MTSYGFQVADREDARAEREMLDAESDLLNFYAGIDDYMVSVMEQGPTDDPHA